MMFIYFIAFVVLKSTPAYSDPNENEPSSSNPSGNDHIDHVHFLVDDISNLYLDKKISDIVLVVDKEEFHAHRVVLASRSGFFKGMLFSDHKEARDKKVTIEAASATSFKVLLKYIYTGKMNLSILKSEVIAELLGLSDYFQLPNLHVLLSEYLGGNIGLDNVCWMLTMARLYQLKELEADSLNFIDIHNLDLLESEDYLSLSPEAFQLILNRDMAYAVDLDIRVFRAVYRWINKNQDNLDPDDKNKILSAVRYQFMNDEELSEVRRSQLVCSGTVILESLTHALDSQEQLKPNVNFSPVTPHELSQIDGGIVIMLDHPSHINYIEMMLINNTSRYYSTYSYYIEVSMDQRHWLRVINHSKYHCRSVQRLWFHRRFVQYIRIVGTENTSNMKFKLLKVMYNTDKMNLMEIKNGLVAPEYNVASSSMNAELIQGHRHIDYNDLVDDDYKSYDSEHGTTTYRALTYHYLKTECIIVELAQPYVLSSMRILLGGYEFGTYSYKVEVSVNNLSWEMIADKYYVTSLSWQLLTFVARPIVYIRITGVDALDQLFFYTSFRCIHLEAPAQEFSEPNVAQLPKEQPKPPRSKFRYFCK